MGKSKNGGTRSFIRGRVGSDVYSIGKNAAGKKQQVVRSLAETVANPQTPAQMRGRMIMSTVMQAVSAMSVIIDHSFDGKAAGQPSISEFIAQNYSLVKADVAAHPATGNKFGLNQYQEKGIKQGAYVVSAGKGIDLQGATLNGTAKTLTIAVGGEMTVGELVSALGINRNDFFTVVSIDTVKGFIYERFHISSELADSTVIAAGNVADLFTTEGNVAVVPSVSGTTVVLTFADLSDNAGIIVSRSTNEGWKHNDVQLAAPTNPIYPSDTALPTYPVGSQRFLNGGSESQSFNPAVSVSLRYLVINGSSVAVGGSVNLANTAAISGTAAIFGLADGDEAQIGIGNYAPGDVFNPSAPGSVVLGTFVNDGVTLSGSALSNVGQYKAWLILNGTIDSLACIINSYDPSAVPTISGVTANGKTIATAGSTSVTPNASSTIVVSTAHCDGLYAVVKQGATILGTPVQIASNAATISGINLEDGKSYNVQVGTYEGGSFTADLTFGGTIMCESAPTPTITSLTWGGAAWNSSKDLDEGAILANTIGVTTANSVGKHACLAKVSNGQLGAFRYDIGVIGADGSVTQGSQINITSEETLYVCIVDEVVQGAEVLAQSSVTVYYHNMD